MTTARDGTFVLPALPRGVVTLKVEREAREKNGVGDFDGVETTADADGRFVLRHLRPGQWAVRGDIMHRSRQEVATGAGNVHLVVRQP